ncbi:hypothetical protein [Candidatus Synchoanobacter obligatus]|uniref:Alpha/beta hydrolase family protein n=1 Tax=Candidatus Synchoanobacter obligatus TaxID=2919597 RepID=A0ABT1L4C2_9GAMM|nr:hypothetical protein [Candidatus Synchoanobacter obligatus]MCP8352027.1 hypothetical protein [Candidatus Synchoanobacter obligatus]
MKQIQKTIAQFLFSKTDHWLEAFNASGTSLPARNLADYFSNTENISINNNDTKSVKKRKRKHATLQNDISCVYDVKFKNCYGENCSVKSHTWGAVPHHTAETTKHVIIFWGGGTSTEGMLSEIANFRKHTNLVVHTFNYPLINDNTGSIYSHDDLVTCSKAIINNLIEGDMKIKPQNTIFYGDCYGAAVAESVYQSYKDDDKIYFAGRVLSNTFTKFTSAAHRMIFCNIRGMLFTDPTTAVSFLVTAAIYALLSPILVFAHLFFMLLPLFGWETSPLKTANQQNDDLWITNRNQDTVLGSAKLADNLPQVGNSPSDWKSINSKLSISASPERRKRFSNQSPILLIYQT